MRPDTPFVDVDEQLVVERDDTLGLLEVRGWSPGPAGTAPIDLRGLAVELDVAEAGALAAAVVLDPARAERALAALIGRTRAEFVHRAQSGLLPAGQARPTGRRARRGANADHPATRLALLRVELDDPALSTLARAAALVEAAAAGRLLGPGLGVGGAARRDAAAAAELLGAVDLDEIAADGAELAAACRAAAAVLDDAGDERRAERLRRVAAGLADLPTRRGDARIAAMASPEAALRPAMAAAAPMAGAASRAKLAAVPTAVPNVDAAGLPIDVRTSARWRSASELEVHVAGAPPSGWWVRAVRGDGTALAIVPLRRGAGRMLLPPGAVAAVDVTHRPDVAAPSPARRAAEGALVAGVDACRAHRLGDPWTAADRWRTCAAGWSAAGDDDRARLAEAYADGRAVPTQPSHPLVVDRLRGPDRGTQTTLR
jgi:hypothetical protein